MVDHDILWPKPGDLDSLQKSGFEKNALLTAPGFVSRPPFWKISSRDYLLKSDSPALKAGFKQIPVKKIGLPADFKFNRDELMRIAADRKIQAEDATRIFNMRPRGGTDVAPASAGGWEMFANVDFGSGMLTRAEIAAKETRSKSDIPLIEMHLDAPDGRLIGIVKAGERAIDVKPVKGCRNLFLVFRQSCRLDYIRFMANK